MSFHSMIARFFLSFSFSESDSLWCHGLQHPRLPCPSQSPGVCLNSCLLSQWGHQTISSSVIPFSCSQSFPASESFPMNWLFTSSGQSIGASTSASVLPVNIQGWFPLGLTGPLPSKRHCSPEPQFKSISSSALSPLYGPTLTSTHDYLENHSFDYMDICWQSDVSVWIHCLGLSQLFFQEASIFYFRGCSHICSDFEPKEIVLLCQFFSPSIYHEVMGPDVMSLVFWMLSFQLFHSLSPLRDSVSLKCSVTWMHPSLSIHLLEDSCSTLQQLWIKLL